METSKIIAEFKKFINVLEQNASPSFSQSSKFIFHRYMGGNLKSTNSKKGEIFLILQSSVTVSKQKFTIKEIETILEQKIHSNSFLMPSDSEFIPILNYFFRNRDEFTIDRKEIISFLQEKILNLQNSIWIENHNVFSFGNGNGNSIQPDCTINFMKKKDNLAFIFQIINLKLIFNESKEISNLNKKISQLNKKIERNYQKGYITKDFEDKQEINENSIQKLKNDLNSTKNEYKKKISQLYQNLQRIESENAELLSENKQFELEMQRLSELNQKLIEEKEEIDENNDLLRENLEESNIKISDLSDEIKSLENLNSELKSSNVQLSDQNKALKDNIRKNTSKIKEILNDIDRG